MQAEEVLKLLQLVADACGESSANDVIRYVNDSSKWATACAFMDELTDIFWVMSLGVMEQPFNNYFSFCPCLLLFGFVDNIIKGQQHESDFISFYLCLSLFGYLLSPISYLLSLISYLLIFLSLAHILLEDIWTISYWLISLG